MTVLDELIVRFRVDLDQLTAGLSKARAAVSAATDKIASAFKGVGNAMLALTEPANLLRGLIIGKLVQSFYQMVTGSLESADALGKLSDRLGIATEKLAALQYAAGLAGVEMGALTAGLQTSQRVLSAAANGGAEAADTFRSLGLSISDLRKMTTDEQFSAYADAINKVGNASDRARLSQALFGKGAGALDALIRDGSEGMREQAIEAEKAGLIISRAEAAKAEIALDSIRKISEAWEGMKRQVAVALAPVFTVLADQIAECGRQGLGVRDIMTDASRKIVTSLAPVLNSVNALVIEWKAVKSVLEIFATGFLGIASLVVNGLDLIRASISVVGSAFKTLWFALKANCTDAVQFMERQVAAGMFNLAEGMRVAGIKGSDAVLEAAHKVSQSSTQTSKQIADDLKRANEEGSAEAKKLGAAWDNVLNVRRFDSFNPFAGAIDELKKAIAAGNPGDAMVAQMETALAAIETAAAATGKRLADALKPAAGMSDDEAKGRRAQLEKDLGDETALENEAYAERLENLNALHEAARISDEEYIEHKRSLALMHKESILGDMTDERELAAEDHEIRMAAIQEAYDQKLVSEEQHLELMAQARENYEARIQKAAEKKALWEQKFDRFMSSRKVQGARQMFTDLSGLMESHSRKAFEIGKVAAIANATVNGIQSAVAAFAAGMSTANVASPALAAAYMAASLATTGMQIAAIASTSFGGGGGGGGGGAVMPSTGGAMGAGGPTETAPQNGAAAPVGTSVTVHMSDDDGIVSTKWVRGLIEQINAAGADGARINRIVVAG